MYQMNKLERMRIRTCAKHPTTEMVYKSVDNKIEAFQTRKKKKKKSLMVK